MATSTVPRPAAPAPGPPAPTSSALTPQNRDVMAQYYAHTNTGDFPGAVQFLTDDVVYRVPGDPAVIPYAGEWRGKDRVALLFEAFNAAFGVTDMLELQTLEGADEVFSVNDEIFTGRSTGRPWRCLVVHHMTFRDGRIASLTNYTDLQPAAQALGDQSATVVPVLAPGRLADGGTAEPAGAPSTQGPEAGDRLAAGVGRYFGGGPDADADLAPDVEARVPGDPRRLRCSGTWRGAAEVRQMRAFLVAALGGQAGGGRHDVLRVVSDGAAATAVVRLRGTTPVTRAAVDTEMLVLFERDGAGRIGRITYFLDTTRLTA